MGQLSDMTKTIELTKGYTTIVDDDDYEWLSEWSWYAHFNRPESVYAARGNSPGQKPNLVKMHRAIMGIDDPKVQVDHINGNKLDNRRSNLRLASNAQNHWNLTGLRADNTSGFKGITWDKERDRWMAQIRANRQQIFLGYFDDPAEAARTYDIAARFHFGDFACTNVDLGLLPEAA